MTETAEIWWPIPGWVDIYEASTEGRIRSVDRRLPIVNRFGDTENRLHRGKVLKASVAKNGYLVVTLTRPGGVRRYAYVHHLVTETFFGPAPEGCEICHENGDKRNCRLLNLRYDTRSNNALDRHRHGTMNLAYGEDHFFHKLTEDDVRWIRANRGVLSQRVMGEMFGVHHTTISGAMRGAQWKHVA